jgi:D-cysteine desulfhydrase
MTGLALGGNKTRKLEYLIHDAVKSNANVVITVGCHQSNHARQTAAACRLYNLECYLFLVDDNTGEISAGRLEGNMLLDEILAAKIIFCDNDVQARKKIQELTAELIKQGQRPYYIPAGGSNEIGCLGYINAVREIAQDEKKLGVKFDFIVFASSSYGTQCGLIIGNKIFNCEYKQDIDDVTNNFNNIEIRNNNTNGEGGDFFRKIYGISICKLFLDSTSELDDKQKMLKFTNDFAVRNGLDLEFKEDDIIYDQRFNSAGYAVMCADDKKAIDLFAKFEAIILDPVYSGRGAAGLIKMIENNEFGENKNVLFIHTGGAPALFTGLYKRDV